MTTVSVKISTHGYNELIYWCHKHVKDRWQASASAFLFANEKEAMMFALKWA
jgi:hypothetical protein